MSTIATRTVPVDGIGPVEVTIAEYGSGQPFLLLHGGAGPASVTGFAELFAAAHDVRVLVPTHPGFGGTPRPEALNSVGGLAALYNTLPVRAEPGAGSGWPVLTVALRHPGPGSLLAGRPGPGRRCRAGGCPPVIEVPEFPVGDGDAPDHDEQRGDGEAGLVDVEVGHEVPEAAMDVQLGRQQADDLDGADEE